MFKPSSATNPDDYIAQIAEPRRGEIIELDKLIQKTVPQMKRHWAYNMIGYGSFHYKSSSGKEGEWPVIALASQKNYISLYICATDDTGYIAEKYKGRLPKASIGRSCVRFKHLKDVDINIIKELLHTGATATKNV